MNPLAGLDIVRTELVGDVKVEDGIVTISLDIPSNDIFAANIKEEIEDKISNLWDVKEVKVRFNDSI